MQDELLTAASSLDGKSPVQSAQSAWGLAIDKKVGGWQETKRGVAAE